MIGAFTTTAMISLFAILALRSPRPRHSQRFNLQFAATWWINELPVIGLWWLLAGTLGALLDPEPTFWWWLVVGLTVLDAVVLGWLLLRMRSAAPALAAAMRNTYGPDGAPRFTRPAWWRIVLIPFLSWRPDVRKTSHRYGPSPRGHRLDVYAPRRVPAVDAPVLVYLHPGGFVMGSKRFGAHPLLYRLAARGWLCVSADYRLRGVDYSDQLRDCRAVLEWVRTHAEEFGGDPSTLFVAGGSAGAHLMSTAALLGEEVSGVIGLYGYYGPVGSASGPDSPAELINPGAPPFLVVHGAADPLVRREDARAFAERLATVSRQPVTYAELPTGNHNFDFFPSQRFHAVTDAVLRFADLTLGPGSRTSGEDELRRVRGTSGWPAPGS